MNLGMFVTVYFTDKCVDKIPLILFHKLSWGY